MFKDKNYKKNTKAGFTLVEIVVYLAVFGVLIGSVTIFARDIFFYNSVTQSDLTAQLEGRRVVRALISELRESSPSSLGAYPIASVATSTITFFSNINSYSVTVKDSY